MIRPEDLADEPAWQPQAQAQAQSPQPTHGPNSPAGQALQSLLAGGSAPQQQYVRFEAAQPVIPPGATGETRRAKVMDFLGIRREGAVEEAQAEAASAREAILSRVESIAQADEEWLPGRNWRTEVGDEPHTKAEKAEGAAPQPGAATPGPDQPGLSGPDMSGPQSPAADGSDPAPQWEFLTGVVDRPDMPVQDLQHEPDSSREALPGMQAGKAPHGLPRGSCDREATGLLQVMQSAEEQGVAAPQQGTLSPVATGARRAIPQGAVGVRACTIPHPEGGVHQGVRGTMHVLRRDDVRVLDSGARGRGRGGPQKGAQSEVQAGGTFTGGTPVTQGTGVAGGQVHGPVLELQPREQSWTNLPASAWPQFSCIFGQAGTGKTYLVKEAAAGEGNLTLAATTGIAAVNMGADIVTLNSLLGYFNTEDLEQKSRYGVVESRLVRLHAAGMRRLVIDEVSMMDGRQLELLLAAFDIVNQSLEQKALEPLSLTLTGDFLQLPPVGVNDKNSKVTYAFEAPQWDRFEITKLMAIRRQANRDFCLALGAARAGHAKAATQYFAPCCQGFVDKRFDGTTLFARNAGADKFNAERLGEIGAKPRFVPSTSWGKLRDEWRQIPQKLELKIGALVMILANEKEELEDGQKRFVYVNGDLGEVVDFAGPEDTAAMPLVKLRRTDRVVTVGYVSREHLVPVDDRRRKEIVREGKSQYLRDKDRYEAVGGITYCPLRVAYASTIHKAQGLTLDTVQINLNDGFMARVGGMTYVALTRCRTREGLRIVGTSALLGRRVAAIEERTRRWL